MPAATELFRWAAHEGHPGKLLMTELKTTSEKLFEQLCDNHGIQWERIPVVVAERRLDYRISIDSNPIIMEVKQMEMNKDSYRSQQALGQKHIVWFRGTGQHSDSEYQ